MAKYSPGSRGNLPSGLLFAAPMWKKFEPGVIPSGALISNDADLSTNLFDEKVAAADYDGSNQLTEYSIDESFIQVPCSISFRFFLREDGADQVFLVKRRGSLVNLLTIAIGVNSASPARLRVRTITTDDNPLIIGDTDLNLNEWYLGIVTISSSLISVYQNNSLVGSAGITAELNTGDFPLNVGYLESPEIDFDGKLSDIYIFDHVLDSEEREIVSDFYLGSKGSSDGITQQRSGSSFAIRNRRAILKRRSVRASHARNAFTHVKSNYSLLSESQKAAFGTNSPSFPRTNSLGIGYNLRRGDLYSSQNISLATESLPLNFTSQSPVSPGFSTTVIIDLDYSTLDMSFDPTTDPVPADWVYRYYLSSPINQSPPSNNDIEVFLMASVPEGEVGDVNVYQNFISKFGETDAYVGMITIAVVRLLHVPSGQLIETVRVTGEIT